jgi:hypothetical protein
MGITKSGFLTGLIVGAVLSLVVAKASEHDVLEAADPAAGFKISGQQYLLRGPGFRAGYVVGSLDAFLLAVHLGGSGQQLYDFNHCMDKWTHHELSVIVERYINENLNERRHGAALLSHKALKAECRNITLPTN